MENEMGTSFLKRSVVFQEMLGRTDHGELGGRFKG